MATMLGTDDELLTVEDVRRLLRVGRGTSYKIIRALGVKVGGKHLRVRRSRLDDFITSRERAL